MTIGVCQRFFLRHRADGAATLPEAVSLAIRFLTVPLLLAKRPRGVQS